MESRRKPVNHRAYWCLFFLLMLLLTIAVRWNIVWLDREVRREGLSSQVFVTARNVLISTLDIETGVRGFLIVGRPDYLRPYHEGLGRLEEDVARLRGLTARDTTEAPHVEAAVQAIHHVMQEFASQVGQAEEEGIESARIRFVANPTKPSVDLIRDHLLSVQVEETRKVTDATASLNRQMSATYLLLDSFSLVSFFLLLAMTLGVITPPVARTD